MLGYTRVSTTSQNAQCWRVLRLHVEDHIPLAAIARETRISQRTLQRWHQLYRAGGVAALDPHPRSDTGTRRTAAETVTFIEGLALTKPRPSLATLHPSAELFHRPEHRAGPGSSPGHTCTRGSRLIPRPIRTRPPPTR
nr:helix-turn-helix domain-containing protein [Rhodococcus sp. OK302]